MAFISTDDGYLTVLRLFATDTEITTDEAGWISSTLLAGEDHPGTAQFLQWQRDLEPTHTGLKTEVVFTSLDAIEISPERDDYTLIGVMGVEPEHQKELLELFAETAGWVRTVPGYRSSSLLRGLDGTFIVNYAQWDGKESFDAFQSLSQNEQPASVREIRDRARSLLTSRVANTYRVLHTLPATR